MKAVFLYIVINLLVIQNRRGLERRFGPKLLDAWTARHGVQEEAEEHQGGRTRTMSELQVDSRHLEDSG